MNDKFLYQPVSPFILNQKFGQNNACISLDGAQKVINCDGNNPPDGYRSVYNENGHTGIDLRAFHGKEVYCAQRGRVVHIDTQERSGLDVRIESEVNGKKYLHIYEHLLGYQPQKGDWVETGQLIGWADNTGYSSGDHLHFELRDEDGNSLDPMLYMVPIFAKDMLAVNNTLLYLTEQVAKLADNVASYLRDIRTKKSL